MAAKRGMARSGHAVTSRRGTRPRLGRARRAPACRGCARRGASPCEGSGRAPARSACCSSPLAISASTSSSRAVRAARRSTRVAAAARGLRRGGLQRARGPARAASPRCSAARRPPQSARASSRSDVGGEHRAARPVVAARRQRLDQRGRLARCAALQQRQRQPHAHFVALAQQVGVFLVVQRFAPVLQRVVAPAFERGQRALQPDSWTQAIRRSRPAARRLQRDEAAQPVAQRCRVAAGGGDAAGEEQRVPQAPVAVAGGAARRCACASSATLPRRRRAARESSARSASEWLRAMTCWPAHCASASSARRAAREARRAGRARARASRASAARTRAAAPAGRRPPSSAPAAQRASSARHAAAGGLPRRRHGVAPVLGEQPRLAAPAPAPRNAAPPHRSRRVRAHATPSRWRRSRAHLRLASG